MSEPSDEAKKMNIDRLKGDLFECMKPLENIVTEDPSTLFNWVESGSKVSADEFWIRVALIVKLVSLLIMANSELIRDVNAVTNSTHDFIHVILKAGIIPGENGTCRCSRCMEVALSLYKEGCLDDVVDKWWLTGTSGAN